LSGSAQFLKSDFNAQMHFNFGKKLFNQTGIIFSLCGNLGMIFPLRLLHDYFSAKVTDSNDDRNSLSPNSSSFINICDRYVVYDDSDKLKISKAYHCKLSSVTAQAL
jgi:hypothetical protein